MRGIILAGGMGTRLSPLTKVTNKHLLPVYDRPMIYYPLEKLVEIGLKDIMIITGPEYAGHFVSVLGNGEEFKVNLTYKYQKEAGGIAQALGLAENFVDGDSCAVILGDNIYEDSFKDAIQAFQTGMFSSYVFLKEVEDPTRFGVAEIVEGQLVGIEEKPVKPKSNLAVTGFYFYPPDVFEIVKTLKPSKRNELEITDVNNHYVKSGNMGYRLLNGFWTDAGTIDSLYHASTLVKNSKK